MHKSLFNIAWVGGRLYSKYLDTLGLTFIPTDAHSPFWILALLCIHPFIFPSESPKGRRQRHFHSPGKQLKLWIIMGSYSRLTLKFWALSHWVYPHFTKSCRGSFSLTFTCFDPALFLTYFLLPLVLLCTGGGLWFGKHLSTFWLSWHCCMETAGSPLGLSPKWEKETEKMLIWSCITMANSTIWIIVKVKLSV